MNADNSMIKTDINNIKILDFWFMLSVLIAFLSAFICVQTNPL